MRSSEILDTSRSPLSTAINNPYTVSTREVLDALRRTGTATPTVRSDTSIYEFPGDLNYLAYRAGA